MLERVMNGVGREKNCSFLGSLLHARKILRPPSHVASIQKKAEIQIRGIGRSLRAFDGVRMYRGPQK